MKMFRSLLIPIDLSPASGRVVRRTGLLPVAPGGRLTLLHVVPHTLPRSSRLRAVADARKAVSKLARAVSHDLPDGVAVKQVVTQGGAAVEIARQAEQRRADLIVLGRGGRRAFRDAFVGSTAERVLRKAHVPVLVVRSPVHGPYRRPLLALDADRAAHDVLDAALRMLPAPRPRLALVHAYDIPYYGTIYPSLSPRRAAQLRWDFRQTALSEMTRFLGGELAGIRSATGDALGWEWHVLHGPPRMVIPRTATRMRADLLALGTHGYRGLAHALLGTVAGDVLRNVECDVLVVPPGGARPGRVRGSGGRAPNRHLG